MPPPYYSAFDHYLVIENLGDRKPAHMWYCIDGGHFTFNDVPVSVVGPQLVFQNLFHHRGVGAVFAVCCAFEGGGGQQLCQGSNVLFHFLHRYPKILNISNIEGKKK